jgi:hypothetical protein
MYVPIHYNNAPVHLSLVFRSGKHALVHLCNASVQQTILQTRTTNPQERNTTNIFLGFLLYDF